MNSLDGLKIGKFLPCLKSYFDGRLEPVMITRRKFECAYLCGWVIKICSCLENKGKWIEKKK